MPKNLLRFFFLPAICAAAPLLQATAFSLTEQARIANDRAEIIFTAEVQHAIKKTAQDDADALTQWAYSYRTTYPEVGMSVMSQQPVKRCIEDCKSKVWVVRANVRLHSEKIERLGQISALLLEKFTLERIRFNLSPVTRAEVEHVLIRRATERFESEMPDGEAYDSIEITSENTARPLSAITHTTTDALDTGYSVIAVKLLRR